MVRLASEGHTVPQIAAAVGVRQETVRVWLQRFAGPGRAGLQDAPRSGTPPPYAGEVTGQVIATALTDPHTLGQPFARWTFARLATYLREEQGVGMKPTRIFEVLPAEGRR